MSSLTTATYLTFTTFVGSSQAPSASAGTWPPPTLKGCGVFFFFHSIKFQPYDDKGVGMGRGEEGYDRP